MKSKFLAALPFLFSAFCCTDASAQLCNKNLMVNFESNKSDVLPTEAPKLDSLIKVISNTKESFLEIYGHTDAKGTEEFNFQLADQRIKAVKAYIADKTKGKTITIKEYNFGEDRPLYTDAKKNLEAKNRRVEISFFALDSGMVSFKKGWATFNVAKEYFAPCGVCGSRPDITDLSMDASGYVSGIRMRDSIGRQLVTIGVSKFETFCIDQKGKCPAGFIRMPAQAYDKDLRFYVSVGDGPKMFWRQSANKPFYDASKKEYVIRNVSLCSGYYTCGKAVDSIVVNTALLKRTTKMKVMSGKTELPLLMENDSMAVATCFDCAGTVELIDSGLAKNGYSYWYKGPIKRFAARRKNSKLNHTLDLYYYNPVVSYTDSVMVVELTGDLAEHAKLNFPDIDSTINMKHYQKQDNVYTFKKPVQHYAITIKKDKTSQYVITDDQIATRGEYDDTEKVKYAKFKKTDAKLEQIEKKKKPMMH
jgi:hypothetical protein